MKRAGHIPVVQILLFLGSLLAQNCRRGREIERGSEGENKWQSWQRTPGYILGMKIVQKQQFRCRWRALEQG